MTRRVRRNHTRLSRRSWRWPPSRAIKSLATGGAVRRAPQSDHVMEGPAGGWGRRRIRAREAATLPAIDVKSLHAKIGELTL